MKKIGIIISVLLIMLIGSCSKEQPLQPTPPKCNQHCLDSIEWHIKDSILFNGFNYLQHIVDSVNGIKHYQVIAIAAKFPDTSSVSVYINNKLQPNRNIVFFDGWLVRDTLKVQSGDELRMELDSKYSGTYYVMGIVQMVDSGVVLIDTTGQSLTLSHKFN